MHSLLNRYFSLHDTYTTENEEYVVPWLPYLNYSLILKNRIKVQVNPGLDAVKLLKKVFTES